jgi:hypothetical protein
LQQRLQRVRGQLGPPAPTGRRARHPRRARCLAAGATVEGLATRPLAGFRALCGRSAGQREEQIVRAKECVLGVFGAPQTQNRRKGGRRFVMKNLAKTRTPNKKVGSALPCVAVAQFKKQNNLK